MTQLIENDTDTEKSGRAPSSTPTCCLLIEAGRPVKGFHQE
ncbi:rCG26801 [Rattus norvegicus]|uniref:RCG26801 n=1 Tax=Rattus norvegicus TaxID=10116 RepID=A6HQ35_RAT|nr:rCG26801 [Rattus norvegicus]